MVNYLRTNLCFATFLAICVVFGANQAARAQTPGVAAPPLNQFYQQLEPVSYTHLTLPTNREV